MTFSDETVGAYADGELDAATSAALEAASAADPELAQRIARQRALRARVHRAFAPVLTEAVPERLLASARDAPAAPHTAEVIALPLRRQAPRARWSWPQWGAIAASLVVGALLGPLVLRAPAGPSLVAASGGQLLAGGGLARALSAQLASNQPPDAPVRIGVSFRDHRGAYCRTFSLQEAAELAGLACRQGASWQVMALAESAAPGAASGGYRQAGSALPPAVAGTLDELIDGEPLDAAAEAAARARDWKP
jgi:anti-sigma factor RsiW